jgi:hypothetical protein
MREASRMAEVRPGREPNPGPFREYSPQEREPGRWAASAFSHGRV